MAYEQTVRGTEYAGELIKIALRFLDGPIPTYDEFMEKYSSEAGAILCGSLCIYEWADARPMSDITPVEILPGVPWGRVKKFLTTLSYQQLADVHYLTRNMRGKDVCKLMKFINSEVKSRSEKRKIVGSGAPVGAYYIRRTTEDDDTDRGFIVSACTMAHCNFEIRDAIWDLIIWGYASGMTAAYKSIPQNKIPKLPSGCEILMELYSE